MVAGQLEESIMIELRKEEEVKISEIISTVQGIERYAVIRFVARCKCDSEGVLVKNMRKGF
jgi:hypothetical protein